jgi:hypothetical protein
MHKPSATAPLVMLATALALGLARGPARAAGADEPGSAAPPAATAEGGAKPGSKTKKVRATKRRHTGAPKAAARQYDPRLPNGTLKLPSSPGEQAALSQALAEHRREQIADADRAARAPTQSDRWTTVLFAIRDLDSHNNPEACFWRAVAYYRMGELVKARKTRQLCELPARDSESLDKEDAAAASLQPPSALPELRMAGELDGEGRPRADAPTPVANPERYAGPSPSPPR